MAVITIDGTRLEVPENKNVLECALEAGIYIPHLCHHPDLPENGSCRMCIVEVEGQEGVTTSCTLRAQDGMVVHTTSERINKLRTLALELLLAGHPEDRCKQRTYAYPYQRYQDGRGQSAAHS